MKFIFASRIRKKKDKIFEEKIKSEAENRGLVKYITFLNTVQDMIRLISEIDINIYPVATMERKFDLPLVLIESLAAGKPILYSDIPPLNEFSSLGCGIGIPKSRAEEFSQMILRFAKKDNFYYSLSRAGRKAVERYFDARIIAQQYRNLYDRILC